MQRLFLPVFIILFSSVCFGQPLAGTDDLGRVLPLNVSAGNPRMNKQVGIFYFLWQGDGTAENYLNLSEIVTKHPNN